MTKRMLLKVGAVVAALAMVTSSFALTASAAHIDEPSGAALSAKISRETDSDESVTANDALAILRFSLDMAPKDSRINTSATA